MALCDSSVPVRLSGIKLDAGSGSNGPNRPDLERAVAGRHPSLYGGGGSARRVPAQRMGAGRGRAHHGVQELEADGVAKAATSWCFGPAPIARRSWSRRRAASVDDARVDPAREKMPSLVKKVCKGERK